MLRLDPLDERIALRRVGNVRASGDERKAAANGFLLSGFEFRGIARGDDGDGAGRRKLQRRGEADARRAACISTTRPATRPRNVRSTKRSGSRRRSQ